MNLMPYSMANCSPRSFETYKMKELITFLECQIELLLIDNYLSLIVQFAFVAQQHFLNISCGILFDISYPVLDILKRFLLCYVIHEHNAHSTSVICRGDRPESLLASSVP